MLDSMYMLDGMGDDYVTCLNFWNEPVNIPDGGDIKDIFDRWQRRFTDFANPETNDGVLGTPGYVAAVLANLADMENEINENSATAWSFLQECVDTYYFDEEGNAVKGWQEISGNRYYFNDLGVMQKGVTQVEGQKYFFETKNGKQQN
jgi:hypothetical protein